MSEYPNSTTDSATQSTEQQIIELRQRVMELTHERDHYHHGCLKAQALSDKYRKLLIDAHDALHRAQLLRERIEITILPDIDPTRPQ